MVRRCQNARARAVTDLHARPTNCAAEAVSLNTFLFLIVVSECYMAGIVVSSDGRRFRHVPLGIGSLKENVSHDW